MRVMRKWSQEKLLKAEMEVGVIKINSRIGNLFNIMWSCVLRQEQLVGEQS